MSVEMKKTPAYLKGLAETRARAAGEIQRYERIAKDVADILETSRKALEACDILIRTFDRRLNPGDIEPIRVNKFYGGKRGKLRDTVIGIVKAEAPEPISTAQIAMEVQVQYQLTFEHPELRARWLGNSIGRLLRVLHRDGLTERLHDPHAYCGGSGLWRWKAATFSSSDDLRAQIESQGGSVVQYDTDEE
jgi:hypothetical protein